MHAIPIKQGLFQFWSQLEIRSLQPLQSSLSYFIQFIQDIENRKSKLFPDRKRIPGRKTKFIVAIALLVHVFAVSKLLQAKRIYVYLFSNIVLNLISRLNFREKLLLISNQYLTLNIPLLSINMISHWHKFLRKREAFNISKNIKCFIIRTFSYLNLEEVEDIMSGHRQA